MTTNQPTAFPRWGGAKTWVLIALIVLLAILVPVGLYFISTIPFTNGTTGANLSVPDTGVVPGTPPPAAANPARAQGANPAVGMSIMNLVFVDEQTKQPIPGLRVKANNGARFTGTTDAQGRVAVPLPRTKPVNNFVIRVSGKNYMPKRLMWSRFQPGLAGDIPSAYTMTMEHGTKIGGKIVDDNGQPVAGATVILNFTKRYSNPHEQVDVNGNNRNRSIKSGDDGTWSFPGAPAHCDDIGMIAWDYQHVLPNDLNTTPVTPVSGLYDGSATYVLLRGVALEGVVTGPDGAPVSGASISFGPQPIYNNVVPSFTTDSTGKFSFQFSPGQHVVLTIHARTCAPEMKQLTMGADKMTLPIMLTKAHRVFGEVVDSRGMPVPNASFNANSWRGLQTIRVQFQADGSGRFRWNEAPGDPVTFNVYAPGAVGKTVVLNPDTDNVVKLGAAIHIRGTVTDADTGRPIEDFQLTPGIVFQSGQQINWQRGWNGEISRTPGGKFDYTYEWSYPEMAIRIEAKNHMPVESQAFKLEDGDARVELKMKPGKDVTATIHAADRSPVAGALAVMAMPRETAFIMNSRQAQNMGIPQSTSGSDGVVDFPPQTGRFKIAVFADAGFAEIDSDELSKSSDVTLAPWGRIEGKMLIGSKPGSDQTATLQEAQGPMDDQDQIQIYDRLTAKTDANGQFSIDRVPPGTWTVGREIPIGPNMSSTCMLETVDVPAGKTAAVSLGGTGRPVVGKVALPARLAARTDWVYSFCQITSMNTVAFAGPPIPLLVRFESAQSQQEWMQKWLKTDDGKKYLADRQKAASKVRNYPFGVSPDGTFRIEDVPAGPYSLSISLRTNDPQNGNGAEAGVGAAQFTVPEMAGGRSDEPLQLDPVSVFELKKFAVGDAVYDLRMRTPDAKDLKLSDFRGKYLLLDFIHPMDESVGSFKRIYAAYRGDGRLALLMVSSGMMGRGMSAMNFDEGPWQHAAVVAVGNITWPVLNTDFDAQNGMGVWLIGPDGKVVAEDLKGDAIQAAVAAAIGAPAVVATQATTAP